MNLGLYTFVYFLCKILGYTEKQIDHYNDKSSFYKTSSMTFWHEISSLADIEGNVSKKLNFSVFSKICFPIPGLFAQKLSILAKQRIETNLCKI